MRRAWSLGMVFLLPVGVGVGVGVAVADGGGGEAARVARRVLDDALPASEREALIREHAGQSDALLAALVADLTPGTKDEYRRIPWVWRVAIAAGKRNDPGELRALLERALPGPEGKLDDWRAVVIGGGLVNGITQAGDWPGRRLAGLVSGDAGLKARWARAVDLAAVMADDPKVPPGTRYDALRMLGTEPWDRAAGPLLRYLVKGAHPELQMGAVSGLADVAGPPECVAHALVSALPYLPERNRELALDGLVRDAPRALALLDAVADGRVKAGSVGARRAEALKSHPDEAVRRRAADVLGR